MPTDQESTASTTIGRAAASECMRPLRQLSDSEGWIWPCEITAMQEVIALLVDAIWAKREGAKIRVENALQQQRDAASAGGGGR